MGSGFGHDADYNLYDKPLFADRTAASIYKNIKKSSGDHPSKNIKKSDFDQDEARQQLLTAAMKFREAIAKFEQVRVASDHKLSDHIQQKCAEATDAMQYAETIAAKTEMPHGYPLLQRCSSAQRWLKGMLGTGASHMPQDLLEEGNDGLVPSFELTEVNTSQVKVVQSSDESSYESQDSCCLSRDAYPVRFAATPRSLHADVSPDAVRLNSSPESGFALSPFWCDAHDALAFLQDILPFVIQSAHQKGLDEPGG